ncbi:MAG: molecular chaperone HtpG [Hyphomicrobiaceae bacterium]|nr:molecular chaperone HtpG [Hyphomicrobiaceae bacterium]
MISDSRTEEAHPFLAEVSRLLHLMVNSVYSDRDIFLRELISNASDACDKLRYDAIAHPELLGGEDRLRITIVPDRAAGTLTIADNGIGMDRQELIENLGTIARSGTRAFLERLQQANGSSGLIGQFGVGFYSAFMVAGEIEVTSRRAGSGDAWAWRSDGLSGFTISPADPQSAGVLPARGTAVKLSLKEDARAFLEPGEIERIVRAYSDHILFPVELEVPGQAARQINTASALWQRSRNEVTPQEYTQAYRSLTSHIDEPALTIHYKAEGRQSYAVLLFIPGQRPYDLFDPDRKGRVKLYVRRVFITDDAGLLPAYLRFVRGAIDSEDVPLNISREMLQKNPLVGQIRNAVTGRVLAELEGFASRDPGGYQSFFQTFGTVLKEGLYEDAARREQLLKLARFRTTQGSSWRSLAEYVASLRPNQTEIYFLAGESLDRLAASPQLEAARARGVEVLLLTDPIDHFWTVLGMKFEGRPFRSLSQGEVDLTSISLTDDSKAADTPAKDADVKGLIDGLRAALGDAVTDVRASKRLTESVVCLVAPRGGADLGLDRLLQRQQPGANPKPVLEVNPGHPLITAIGRRIAETGKEEAAELARLLLDEARILEGETPADPADFVARMNRMMLRALGAR